MFVKNNEEDSFNDPIPIDMGSDDDIKFYEDPVTKVELPTVDSTYGLDHTRNYKVDNITGTRLINPLTESIK